MHIQENVKLFMVLLGSKAHNRTVEQHDYFFGIGSSVSALIPDMRLFWPEAGDTLHIDGWREITYTDGHAVQIVPASAQVPHDNKRLFFINLGGYRPGLLEEQHYTLLTVQPDRKAAIKSATSTQFFKQGGIAPVKSASAHIDEKYGIDVDDIYRIDDLLPPNLKQQYHILLHPQADGAEDEIHLGYYKLNKP